MTEIEDYDIELICYECVKAIDAYLPVVYQWYTDDGHNVEGRRSHEFKQISEFVEANKVVCMCCKKPASVVAETVAIRAADE